MSSSLLKVLAFVTELENLRAAYRISVVRPDALMVEIAVPGQRWEVEFFDSGEVEVERFNSTGEIADESCFVELRRLLG